VEANHREVTVRIGAPALSQDRLDLWVRFHRHGHETKGWPLGAADGPGTLLENPFPTEEWTYFVGNRLIAVAYVDALPEGLSAIYCYYDPAERARSLGTFNILSLLACAHQRGLPHVYLGYYVAGCRSMEYKRKFRPNEVLRANGRWEVFDLGSSSVSHNFLPSVARDNHHEVQPSPANVNPFIQRR
jgi:arginine-tRNA-protein transferase